MDPFVYILLIIFVLLMCLRVPIAFSMGFTVLIYLLTKHLLLDTIAIKMTYAANSFTLLAVPLFLFAGNIMNVSGITNRIFDLAKDIMGPIPGNLAHVNVVASLIFAGCSGSALAEVGGLGIIEMKAMDRAGYKRSFSAAIIIAAATIGPIFPPSIPFIIYAAVTETSALRLLIGGVIPGISIALVLMATVAIVAKVRHYPKGEKKPLRALLYSFLRAFPALLTPILLIGGMTSGIFSPTEGAAVTAAYALILGFVYRELDSRKVYQVIKETMLTTSIILFIAMTAILFGWVIALEQIPQVVEDMLLSITRNPYILFMLVNVFLLILGCFVDTMVGILLFAPIANKVLSAAGFDPTHIGLVFVFNLMLGLITPPVGMSLYLVCSMSKEPMDKILRECVPFFLALLVALIAFTCIPQITLFLPNLLK